MLLHRPFCSQALLQPGSNPDGEPGPLVCKRVLPRAIPGEHRDMRAALKVTNDDEADDGLRRSHE
jgi:hypothetical protein